MKNECTFCILQNEHQDRYFCQNKYFYSVFDDYPVNPGHILLISKRHILGESQLNPKEWESLLPFLRENKDKLITTKMKDLYIAKLDTQRNPRSKEFLSSILQSPFMSEKPQGYNIGINEEISGGQTIPHLHIHLIPRYIGDTKNYIGGVRHVIEGRGNYKIPLTK